MPTKKQQANLRPFNKRTESELREIAKKGGVKSGESRKERKTLRESLILLLSAFQADGKTTNQQAMLFALFGKAIEGDVKAIELISKIIGENGVEKVELNAEVKRSASDLFATLGAMKK